MMKNNMTIHEALTFGAKKLKSKIGENDSPILDAEILLSASVNKTKEYTIANPSKQLTSAQIKKYKNFITRRARREPIAYITGHKEFYGLDFLVSPAVLIPRPDTETLIDAISKEMSLREVRQPTDDEAIQQPKDRHSASRRIAMTNIFDVGTGSGAIAITLAKLLPKARVFASDISPASLTLAKKNAKRLGAGVIFKKGNLLKSFFNHHSHPPVCHSCEGRNPNANKKDSCLRRNDTVITANLPYLSRAEWKKCQPEVKKYEPYDALVGGKTGTEIYEKLFKEINKICHSCGGRNLVVSQKDSRLPICHSRHSATSSWSSDESGNPNANKKDTCLRGNDGQLLIFLELGHNQKYAIEKLAQRILKPEKIEFFKDLAGKWRVAKIVVSSR